MSRSPGAPGAGGTLHIAVLGIDGSGKSTLVDALPELLAAEFGVVAGGAGDDFRVAAPDQDHLAPDFSPDGIPLSARLARRFRLIAKRWVDHRKIYPIPKLLQMLFQDAAARRIGRKYRAIAVVCDGNALLSAVGRGANYRRPASADGAGSGGDRQAPQADALRDAIAFLQEGRPLSPASRASLPPLGVARALVRIARLFGFDPLRLPDVVLYLDLPPEEALARILSRGRKIDRHENLPDLTQAREMYLRALDAFAAYKSGAAVARIAAAGRSAAEVCEAAVAALTPRLTAAIADANLRGSSPLGTSKDLSPRSFAGKVLNHRYLLYLLGHALRDAWREPAFILSAPGRKFLREGYSGGVMRVIYDQDAAHGGFADRIFMGYPLHRAVYDRLGILSRHLEAEISTRLAAGRPIRIFTAPSGHAYDLFLPLESIARRGPARVRGVRLVAADLDPHGELEAALLARAAALSIPLAFFRGDLASEALRRRFAENGPYDLALFVGLSSWLPKPDTLGHLRWLRSHLAPAALLVTDAFTPAPYALSGRYAGYKAHYYTPRNYALLLEAAGFDGLGARVESGRDGINHVFVVEPREDARDVSLADFNSRARGAILKRAQSERFDLLVIGGGITGVSIFRDAALRGMRVALLDAKDFSSGTSSKSSKLIHGGLRYLRNLGLHLARESCRERNLHIRLNKRLVRPIPFLIPIYRGGESTLELRLGMLLYEALSGFRNAHRHRFLTREETLLLAPGIPVQGLSGGCLYYDAIVSDSRWTVEVLKDGVRAGGTALSYAPVTGLTKEGGRVAGVTARDALGGGAFSVGARAVVNATGVFADSVRRMDDPAAPAIVSLSKGTHFVFAKADVPLGVTTVFASPIDGRSLFLVKRQGCYLYGTTDDWEEADPGSPKPGERDSAYLLESLSRFMPESGLGPEKVQFAYSGFRPLLRDPGAAAGPGSASREDHLECSASGLLSVVGGKLTTARIMAIRVLDRVIARLGPDARFRAPSTATLSIGGTNAMVAEGFADSVRRCPSLAGYFRVLFRRYGLDARSICEEAARIHEGRHSDPRAEPIRAEVQYVCRHEMVCTLEDLMERRAGFLWWSIPRRLERLRYAAHLLREELDLSDAEFEEQYEAYREKLTLFHTLPRSARAPVLGFRGSPNTTPS